KMLVNSNGGTLYHGSIPKKLRDTIVAITEEKTSGANRFIEMLPSTINEANTAPAIGALYAAAIPDAAPQPTSNRNRYGGQCAHCPSFDASVAVIWVIPPSRPIDAPVPMLISDDAACTSPLRIGNRPSPATTTSSILAVPVRPMIFKPHCRISPAARPPIVGSNTRPPGLIISAASAGSPGCRKKNNLTASIA